MKDKNSKKSTYINRLAIILKDSNDAITVQDLEGNIKEWNKGAEKIYGWNEDEALAMNIKDIVPEKKAKINYGLFCAN